MSKQNKKADNGNKINKTEERKQKAELRAKKRSEPGEVKGFLRVVPVILVAVSLFTALCFITGETGTFGAFISKFFKGLFSYMAYSIPFFIALHAVFFYNDIREHKLVSRTVISILSLITLAKIAYIISAFSGELVFNVSSFYNDGILNQGGGFIGGIFGFLLAKLFGKIGLIIIIVLSVVLFVFYYLQGSGAMSRLFLEKLGKAANFGASIEKRAQVRKQAKKEAKLQKQIETDDKKHAEIYNDDFFHADNGLSHLEIPELGIMEKKNGLTDTNILRETVIRNDFQKSSDIKIEFEEKDEPKKEKRKNIYSDPAFIRVDNIEKDTEKNFRKDDIIYEEAPIDSVSSNDSADEFFKKAEESTRAKESIRDYGIEDSASAVFTSDFDPFDIAMNEKRASKQSSKAAEIKKEAPKYSEIITELTPEQYEHAKRLEQFEESRRAALNRRAEAEKAKAAEAAANAEKTAETYTVGNSYQSPEFETKNGMEKPTSYQNVRAVADLNSTYETNSGDNSSNENSRYRFVKEVSDEPRISYSNSTDSNSEKATDTQNSQFNQEVFTAKKRGFEFIIEDEEDVRPENEANENSSNESSFDEYSKPNYSEKFLKDEPTDDIGDEDADDGDDFKAWNTFSRDEEREAPATLEVSRSIIEPNIEIPEETVEKHGLDFSFDDDDEDDYKGTDDDTEEFVQKEAIPKEEQNPKINEYRNMFTVFSDNEPSASDTENPYKEDLYKDGAQLDDEDYSDEKTSEYSDEYESNDDEPPFDAPSLTKPLFDKPVFEAPAEVTKKEEKTKAIIPDYSNYRFPPIDLLKKAVSEDLESVKGEMQTASEQLISTLDSFNIRATLRGMERGPRVTRYSIVPAKGIRVNQIEKLSDDIALAMAAESIRIEAPIPGKSAVGIEVPNKVPTIVSLRELLESDEFMNNKSKTAVCLGKSVEGTSVFGDIGKMPHVLVAGATGMGKSVCMNSLITSILYKARPDEVKFIMIDPKKVEFALYKGIPHLLVPVVTDPKQAAGSLLWAVDEMNRRYEIIEKLSIRNIDTYNEMVSENPELGAPLPKIIIFIDELNDLMMQARDPVENLIMLIAQKARAAGIHLVIGTQRPSVNVITGVIKANIPTRIACKVTSGIDSRTILEQTGAEKLIGKGDMLFATSDKPNPVRVQGAYVSESETNAIVDFVKKQAKGEIYDEQAMEDMKRAAQKCDKKNGDDDFDDDDDEGGIGYLHDRKFLNAVELAIRNGSVATSFLQRKLHIGYGKAAQYIDIMEDLGIVGEKNGSKARDILISMSEWNEKLSRLTCD